MSLRLSVLFIVSLSVLMINNNAYSIIATDNNTSESSSFSTHSTNETHNVNQSSMDMNEIRQFMKYQTTAHVGH
jgi:hypothetical protein